MLPQQQQQLKRYPPSEVSYFVECFPTLIFFQNILQNLYCLLEKKDSVPL